MALIDNFNAANDATFRSKVVAALWAEAVQFISNPGLDPNIENDKRRIKLARQVLETSHTGMTVVVNALASAGLTAASNDTQISNAIDQNWNLIGLLFDTNITG